MQTYTHLGIGLVASQVFFPEDNLSQALVVGGSLVVDVPSASMYVLDKLRGKEPLKEQSKGFVIINNVFHSLLLWLVSIFSWPIFIGVYSHLVVDVISHKDERFKETDPTWIWPLSWRIPGLFEARESHGELYSPWQIGIFFFCLLVFVWLKFF